MARSSSDRVAIGSRSWFFVVLRLPSDEALIVMKIRRARAFHAASLEAVRSRSHDLHLVKIGRSRRVHVAKGGTCDHFT